MIAKKSLSIAAKAIVLATLLISGSASAQEWSEECLWPGSWDSAYVPCVSAVDYGNGNVDPGWRGDNNNNGSSNKCYAYNRDGRDCSFVGYSEGQEGTPWGSGSGKFRCTEGCLQFVGQ